MNCSPPMAPSGSPNTCWASPTPTPLANRGRRGAHRCKWWTPPQRHPHHPQRIRRTRSHQWDGDPVGGITTGAATLSAATDKGRIGVDWVNGGQ